MFEYGPLTYQGKVYQHFADLALELNTQPWRVAHWYHHHCGDMSQLVLKSDPNWRNKLRKPLVYHNKTYNSYAALGAALKLKPENYSKLRNYVFNHRRDLSNLVVVNGDIVIQKTTQPKTKLYDPKEIFHQHPVMFKGKQYSSWYNVAHEYQIPQTTFRWRLLHYGPNDRRLTMNYNSSMHIWYD